MKGLSKENPDSIFDIYSLNAENLLSFCNGISSKSEIPLDCLTILESTIGGNIWDSPNALDNISLIF